MFTKNETQVMNFLIRNFDKRHSINEIGRKLDISPRGIYKILKKLEKMNAIYPERIGNAIYYKVNLDEEIGRKLAEFVLVQNDLNSYAKVQAEDLKALKNIALACVLYGSVITKGSQARDIDVMFVLDDKMYAAEIKTVNKKIREISKYKPKKIHDIILTEEDLINALKKGDKVVLDVIKNGKILWGSEVIVEAIQHVTA